MQVSDPLRALDLDLAIAERARDSRRVALEDLLSDVKEGENGFYSAVLLLLSDVS